MRTITKTIGGKEYTLTASFAASAKIAESVGDPLEIARESSMEAYFLGNGIPYTPKWKFTIANLVKLLVIATGEKQAAMEEAVFDEGFLAAKEIAVEYLGQIIGPQPESPVDSSGDKPTEKSDGPTS